MAPNTRFCASLSSDVEMCGVAIEDDTKMSRVVDACTDDLEEKEEVYLTKEELNVVELFKLSRGNEMTHEDLVSELFKMSQGNLVMGIVALFTTVHACDAKIVELKKNVRTSMPSDESLLSRLDNVNALPSCKSSASLPCDDCVALLNKNDEYVIDMLNENAFLPCMSCKSLSDELELLKSNACMPCTSCDALHKKNNKLKSSIIRLKANAILQCASCAMYAEMSESNNSSSCTSCSSMLAETDSLKSNASMPCDSCVALRKDLDCAKVEIGNLMSLARKGCNSCIGMLAENEKLKLDHSTCLEKLEIAKAKIARITSMPSSTFSSTLNDDACLNSCAHHDALHDMHMSDFSSNSCTSCHGLKNEVEALKLVRDDMSAKLVEHNDMSASLEKENDLLRTTYAECIEKEMQILRDAPCDICERLKSQNEVLLQLCKSLDAKLLDSRNSSHSDFGVLKTSSLSWELSSSHVERESLGVSTCAIALDDSSLANTHVVGSCGVAQGISNDKGASCSNGTSISKEKYHCTFCKKDGHVVNGVNLVVNGRRIGTKRGLGARRSRGRVRSRVIHTVHVERTRIMDGFTVWPQNRRGDEDGVLTRVKANGRPVQVKGPDGLGPRRLDGHEASKPVVDGFSVWASKPTADGFPVWASKPAVADGGARGTIAKCEGHFRNVKMSKGI
ncbi:hypothetical protein EJB05_55848, partial [Eragrostis curvula]